MLRILFLADSHLGLDLPAAGRVVRRRRGDDFLANHRAALRPALAGEVDLVVHGGDVFDRPDVSAATAYQAYAPLIAVAERGIPVFVVPGNHERSRLPHAHLANHARIHVFDRPRTFVAEVRGVRIVLAGFPYERRAVRTRFPFILDQTGWAAAEADVRFLCMHHCAEGARVGPNDFTFTSAGDVVRVGDIPHAFTAVLSGHIHRQQVLERDLRGRPLRVPVIYAGSIERTALAEKDEQKGYFIVHVGEGRVRCEHRPLPARPMIYTAIDATGLSSSQLSEAMRRVIARAPVDAVLTIGIEGAVEFDARRALSASHVRSLAPPSMNVALRMAEERPWRGGPSIGRVTPTASQLELY